MTLSRFLKWILSIIGVVAAVVMASLLLMSVFLSGIFDEPSKEEVARVVSPAGNIDAVLIETNDGATTSFGYEVYVVAHAAQPSDAPEVTLYGAIRNQQAYGANLVWTAQDSLAVEYLSAKTSTLHRQTKVVGAQTIHILLREGITDPAAPPGGMLYNVPGG